MILQKIIDSKKIDLAGCKNTVPLAEIMAQLPGLSPPLPLAPALRRHGEVAIIAEIKKASPSKGILRRTLNPVEVALEYELAGAVAVSVLTEKDFFRGHPSDLTMVKRAVNIPVLRKDFIIDPYQIYESRLLGADAVLLIVAALPGGQLKEYKALAEEMGMSCLVEAHTQAELERALSAGAGVIGINNRDLKTFKTSLDTTFKLSGLIDKRKTTVVSESGIRSRADVQRLMECGVHAALVGETLVCSVSPGEALRELAGYSGEQQGKVVC